MITTVSDLLEEFRAYALDRIEKQEHDVRHRVTIGEMFEGLTQNLLSKSLFDGLNLRVVQRSFIYNDLGTISDELDCLLVVGDGQQISFSNRYKYHIKDVIAVLQVKKNLYANDIEDSNINLQTISNISIARTPDPFVGRLHRNAYRALVGKELPDGEELDMLPDREKLAYHLLLMEAFRPLQIVIGYYGYNTEYALREGFVKKFQQIMKVGSAKGYSPAGLPSLYICGDYAIVKNNGMPMAMPFDDNPFYWAIFATSSGRPMYYLLQLIWTRLCYIFELSSQIFGDDYGYEPMHPFLSCRERKLSSFEWGWEFMYHYLTKEQLSLPLPPLSWEPSEINIEELVVIQYLVVHQPVSISNSMFQDFLQRNELSVDQIIKNLIAKHLVYMDRDKIGLLLDELIIHVDESGKVYVGENVNGEMSYFLKRENLL